MKKLVKKSMPKTITAFKHCKCSLSRCMSSAKGQAAACTDTMKIGLSQSNRYN